MHYVLVVESQPTQDAKQEVNPFSFFRLRTHLSENIRPDGLDCYFQQGNKKVVISRFTFGGNQTRVLLSLYMNMSDLGSISSLNAYRKKSLMLTFISFLLSVNITYGRTQKGFLFYKCLNLICENLLAIQTNHESLCCYDLDYVKKTN